MFILLHSPLVGPMTWLPVAEELQRRGHLAIVPSFLPVLANGSEFSRAFGLQVAGALADVPLERPLILVAHSAAGAFIPAIRTAVKQPITGYIFVDARLPQAGVTLFDDMGVEMVKQLRGLARDGRLPPWSEWFGPEAMKEVIPDSSLRARFVAECPAVPLALFEERIPVFAGWPDAPCAYLRLSKFYVPQTEFARAAGWPVLEMDAGHLHMLVEPTAVAEAILQLAQDLEETTWAIAHHDR
jgi:hypothetical protein